MLRGGENVYCAEVETALFACEPVAECAVFALDDERLGEEVAAAILLKRPGATDAGGKFVKRELHDTLDLADAQ